MKRIAIIGHGYVGRAMARYFKDHFPLVIMDKNKDMLPVPDRCGEFSFEETGLEHVCTTRFDEVNACDLVVICVPTPMLENEDGRCDTSIVEEVLGRLEHASGLVLIKSTVPPGTTRRLQEEHPRLKIAFSPEYIGEGKYHVPVHKGYAHPTDMKQHEFYIFGGGRETTSRIIQFFLPVSGPSPVYAQTDSTTAELVKYMENSWGAAKVSFCNEFFEIAKAFGCDYNEVRELFLLDGRTERMHTAVFEDKRGFGGKCYPKDVNAIVRACDRAGYSADFMKEVLRSNDRFRAEYRG